MSKTKPVKINEEKGLFISKEDCFAFHASITSILKRLNFDFNTLERQQLHDILFHLNRAIERKDHQKLEKSNV